MYYCDHGHAATEVRRLPLGDDSAIIVCQHHYHTELQFRLESGAWDITDPTFYPAWELLRVYGEES